MPWQYLELGRMKWYREKAYKNQVSIREAWEQSSPPSSPQVIPSNDFCVTMCYHRRFIFAQCGHSIWSAHSVGTPCTAATEGHACNLMGHPRHTIRVDRCCAQCEARRQRMASTIRKVKKGIREANGVLDHVRRRSIPCTGACRVRLLTEDEKFTECERDDLKIMFEVQN